MSARLYVSNLPYAATEIELRELFERNGYGVDDAVIIKDRDGARSRGFGFVSVRNALAAASAIRQLNGADLGERPIKIAMATPRAPR